MEGLRKRGVDIDDLKKVVEMLANQKILPDKYRDHFLTGKYRRM